MFMLEVPKQPTHATVITFPQVILMESKKIPPTSQLKHPLYFAKKPFGEKGVEKGACIRRNNNCVVFYNDEINWFRSRAGRFCV